MSDSSLEAALFLGLLLGFVIGCAVGGCTQDSSWRRDAISRGVAEYNKKTGEWRWTKEKEKITAEDDKQTDGAMGSTK